MSLGVAHFQVVSSLPQRIQNKVNIREQESLKGDNPNLSTIKENHLLAEISG